ncbi:TPA: hypothetical protein N0F65_011010 [Lagenidium giganteum]|uniref:Uncharacterized protein n=1 Tax=Lagenidium giganteum TaxID=4803 RepID=A0AAV2ZBG2_9STRA|nr:TPA: hypothetical protein N0F65_011010 [Lagenidium giganteum]
MIQNTFNKVFQLLQSVMGAILECDGDNTYKVPHS